MKSKGKKLVEHLVNEYHRFAPSGTTLASWIIDYLNGVSDTDLEEIMKRG